jgi:hypothetical protein
MQVLLDMGAAHRTSFAAIIVITTISFIPLGFAHIQAFQPANLQSGYVPNLSAARARALAASSSRFLGGAVVASDRNRRFEMAAMSSIAAWNAASLALDGLLKPVIFLTNWSDAAWTSSVVTGGSKLKSVLMFLHICLSS